MRDFFGGNNMNLKISTFQISMPDLNFEDKYCPKNEICVEMTNDDFFYSFLLMQFIQFRQNDGHPIKECSQIQAQLYRVNLTKAKYVLHLKCLN
ncbi:hypothetical protein FGO68_gene7057 [Halteria grandinella]|uniref:Uncharacterized protein n=1 Tax=Halteria grandinella TaxID=5974 RepID=A0A8J8NQL8_HALGN|nr:hypothetical protein FGO68_gene7057 [Halteria grandinella]